MPKTDYTTFKIQDRVASASNNGELYGSVCGILSGEVYLSMTNTTVFEYKKWYSLYPGWENGFVYFVHFDKPQYSITVEDFTKQENITNMIKSLNLKGEQIKQLYQHLAPSTSVIVYPESDLVIEQSREGNSELI